MSSLATLHRVFGTRPRSGRVVDLAVTAAALAATVAQLSHGGIAGSETGAGELDWAGAVLAAGSTLPLLGWRRAPRAVFVVTASAAVLLGALGYPLTLAIGPAVALFLLAASRDDAEAWTRADTVTVTGLFVAYLVASALGGRGFPASELLHSGLAWGVAWFAGERARLRHEHILDLARRALETEREAERERLLAVAEERTRIARDLHDSAGHAINVIVMRAGTARLRRDPERSQAALEAIEELARKTVGEIDQIVGSLRDDGAAGGAVDAPPGLASVDTLVARQTAAGLDVTVTRRGTPHALERAVDQAVYRILQEALTNAARHGTGKADLEIRFGDADLELTVTNTASDDHATRTNGGHGLIGMRERATLLGGSLDAGHVGSAYRVRAHLPYTVMKP